MRLDEFALVCGRAPGRRDWWLERFAEVCQDLPDRARLRNERDQPNVAAAVRALERKLLPHPGQEFRPGNPGGVVRAGLLMRVTAASRGVTVAPMPAGSGVAPLADVADGERRNGFSQLVIRRKHPVIPMPVLPRRRDEISEPVEELKRREFDDAIGPRPRGLAAAAGARPIWRLCVWAARSGCGRSGRLGRGSRRAAQGRRVAGPSISGDVPDSDTRHAVGDERA